MVDAVKRRGRPAKQVIEPTEQVEEPTPKMARLFRFSEDCTLTGFGHYVQAKAGDECNLPPKLHAQALAKGAKPADGGTPFIPAAHVVKKRKYMSVEDKNALITEAMKAVISVNNNKDFGANGRPKMEVIHKMLDFRITISERDHIWTKLKAEMRL